MVTLTGVRLAQQKDNKPASELQHPQGIMVQGKQGNWINVSSGDRSGIKRPFVIVTLEETNSKANAGGHNRVVVYWGQFADATNLQSEIKWQRRIPPTRFQGFLNAGIVDFDLIATITDNFAEKENNPYIVNNQLVGNKVAIYKELQSFGIEKSSFGEFVTIPSNRFPNVSMREFRIDDRFVDMMSTFVWTADLENDQKIFDAFAELSTPENPVIIMRGSEELSSPALLAKKSATRQVDPAIIAKENKLKALALPSNDEMNLSSELSEYEESLQLLSAKADKTAEDKATLKELADKAKKASAELEGMKNARMAQYDELSKN